MSKSFVFAGIFAAGLAVVGGYVLSTSAVQAQDAVDGPGPNLVIEVDGATKGEIVIDLSPKWPQNMWRRLWRWQKRANMMTWCFTA